jgi:hypothetical protein
MSLDITHPFNMGVYGPSKSGKSYLIKYLLSSIFKQFHCIVIISGSATSGNYDYLKSFEKKSKKLKTHLLNGANIISKIKHIIKTQNENKVNNIDNKILIVFDDIAGLIPNGKSIEILKNLNASYRWYNASILFAYQVVSDCPTFLRKNQESVCLFKINDGNDIINCKKSFLNEMRDINSVREYFKKGFSKKYTFLFIDRKENRKFFAIVPHE